MPQKASLIGALAAVVIAAAASFALDRQAVAGGAATLQRGIVVAFQSVSGVRDIGATDLAVGGDTPQRDLDMLDYSLEKVRNVYYRPVDARALLKGEVDGITKYLKAKHVVAALVAPDATAVTDQSSLEDAANGVLKGAFARYGGGRISATDLTYAAISGLLGSLSDPYTEFMTAREYRGLSELIRGGGFGGIGIYIGQDAKTKQTVIIDPIVGTPAFRAGLKPGDVILAVDGRRTGGLALDPVMNMIRGRVGTTVSLLVHRKGAPDRTVSVVREQIQVPSVSSKMIDNGIGYIQLYDFGDHSASEVSKALQTLSARGAKAFILDLRNNGGGLLQAAVDVSSKFIADGPIVSTIDRQGQVQTDSATQDAIAPHPLVVLVNQYSASASEITAGAIQDTHAGTLIGTRTFGKGVVQTIYDLPDGSVIKVTTARYVTPNGRDINKKGIMPNIVVQMDPRAIFTPAKDVQLKAAVGYLKKQLALR